MQGRHPRRPGSAGSTRLASDFKTVEKMGVAKKLEQRQHSPIRGRTTSLGAVSLGGWVCVYVNGQVGAMHNAW